MVGTLNLEEYNITVVAYSEVRKRWAFHASSVWFTVGACNEVRKGWAFHALWLGH